jgi:hypothetical protein
MNFSPGKTNPDLSSLPSAAPWRQSGRQSCATAKARFLSDGAGALHATTPVNLNEIRDMYFSPTCHSRIVGADASRGPVGGSERVDPGLALLDNAAHELMDQVGVRPMMPASLFEG